jgi:hypothetical protein
MVVSTIQQATSLITVDATPGYIWYVSNTTRNFSANIINVPAVNNIFLDVKFILNQASCGYLMNTLLINGVPVKLKWYNDNPPVPRTYGMDIERVTLVNLNYTWVAMAQLEHYN